MKRINVLLITIFFLTIIFGGSNVQGAEDVLFQSSMINALDKGIAEGEMTIKDLKQHGDFGIGTLNAIDGEMLGLDGNYYRMNVDGVANLVDDSMKTPFAAVTFFKPDKTFSLNDIKDYKELKQQIDNLLPTKNIFYAIKIKGTFKYIKARSVPRQSRPYPTLKEVFKTQRITEFRNVQCTFVGFRCPVYVEGINFPGHHFHFVTEDRKAGGHIYECHLEKGVVEIDYIPSFYLELPESKEFFKLEGLEYNSLQ